MKVGVTGSQGFVGWHLRCALFPLKSIQVECATRDTFSNPKALESFVASRDVIVHLAGINRASDEEVYDGNIKLANDLVNACLRSNSTPNIIYSSSTHAINPTTVYGKAKFEVAEIFRRWAQSSRSHFVELVIPHVYGEYGLPEYNSAVATFCHKMARGQPIEVNGDGQLELVHVQDLCDRIIDIMEHSKRTESVRIKGTKISVVDTVHKLKRFASLYKENTIPDLDTEFERNLFNTYRGAIPYEKRKVGLKKHVDERGWLFETIKVKSGGQNFISSTEPGITRGQHFHRRKFERFCVVKGEALISIRKVFNDDIIEYRVSGNEPCYVDMPTLHTHNIRNVGDSELITLFWSNEIFDPENPDTYWLEV